MAKLLMCALGGMIMVFLVKFGGEIEGRFFPVMGKLEISDPSPVSTERTSWKGRAAKLRNCNFVRVEWFLGPRGGRRVEIEMKFTDKPEIRSAGVLLWEGIVVDLTERVVRRNSHADALHQCPHRPWLTRTQFYDSEAKQ